MGRLSGWYKSKFTDEELWKEWNFNYLNKWVFYQTKLWRARRNWMIRKFNYACQDCGFVGKYLRDLEVHHLCYNNGFEKPEDLVVLCHSCHERRHGRKLNYKKKHKF